VLGDLGEGAAETVQIGAVKRSLGKFEKGHKGPGDNLMERIANRRVVAPRVACAANGRALGVVGNSQCACHCLYFDFGPGD
jgi:hypothetical protein